MRMKRMSDPPKPVLFYNYAALPGSYGKTTFGLEMAIRRERERLLQEERESKAERDTTVTFHIDEMRAMPPFATPADQDEDDENAKQESVEFYGILLDRKAHHCPHCDDDFELWLKEKGPSRYEVETSCGCQNNIYALSFRPTDVEILMCIDYPYDTEGLNEKYGNDGELHLHITREKWKLLVTTNETIMGYWDFVEDEIEDFIAKNQITRH